MALWTAEVFVDSSVGRITAQVEASTHYGAEQQIKRIYGPYEQLTNLRQVRGGGGGSSSSGSGGGLGLVLVLIIGAAVLGGGGGGEKQNRPSTPPESLSEPQSQVIPKTYANPAGPCVTENFEPC